MSIRGILFDKDGTLIDFYSLWLNAAMEVIPKFLQNHGIVEEEVIKAVFRAIGVEGGKVDPHGALAYKSYEEIGKDVADVLAAKGYIPNRKKLWIELRDLFQESVTKDGVDFQTFTDLELLMEDLKNRGVRIGLATADTKDSASVCMEHLGILDYMDYLGADDGRLKPKPEPDLFEEFRNKYQFEPQEIAVVGDTPNDMKFAAQCGGVAIGVLSGVGQREDMKEADYLIPSVKELPNLLDVLSENEMNILFRD